MSKGLEALKRLIDNKVFISLGRTQGKKQFANDINIIQKGLKALDIIEEKNVSIPLIKNAFDLNYYNKTLRYYRFKNQCLKEHLTQEEFDLLKEVLQ